MKKKGFGRNTKASNMLVTLISAVIILADSEGNAVLDSGGNTIEVKGK